MAGLSERLRSPAARAQRGAGPPIAFSAVAIVVSTVAMVGLAASLVAPRDWGWLVLIPIALATAAAIADHDGWSVREAMVYVAIEQRRHWQRGRLPATKQAAAAWLDDPTNADATAFERAAVMVTAGRHEEALAAISGAEATSTSDLTRQVRLAETVRAMANPKRRVDLDAVRLAAASLPVDERRYNIVSAGWSQAWLDIVAGRPWRNAFAEVAREGRPYAISMRFRLFVVALQQLVLPISIALAAVLVLVVFRF